MTKVRVAEYNIVKLIINKKQTMLLWQCYWISSANLCEEWVTLGHAINSVVGLISRVFFLIEL